MRGATRSSHRLFRINCRPHPVHILDNITITWLTKTAISGARLYWESKIPDFSVKGVSIPVAVSAFPDEIDLCPRSWRERRIPS